MNRLFNCLYINRGNRAVSRPSFWRNPRFSVIGAVCVTGIVEYTVLPNSVNGHKFFFWFCVYLAPKLSEFPGVGSVLLLDNVSIHKYRPFVIVTDLLGIHLVYLPPYSPWLNIIEYLFCMLKNGIRRMGVSFTQNILYNIVDILEAYRHTSFRSLIRDIGYSNY